MVTLLLHSFEHKLACAIPLLVRVSFLDSQMADQPSQEYLGLSLSTWWLLFQVIRWPRRTGFLALRYGTHSARSNHPSTLFGCPETYNVTCYRTLMTLTRSRVKFFNPFLLSFEQQLTINVYSHNFGFQVELSRCVPLSLGPKKLILRAWKRNTSWFCQFSDLPWYF